MKLIQRKTPARTGNERSGGPRYVALVAGDGSPCKMPPLTPLLETARDFGIETLILCPPRAAGDGEREILAAVGAEEALRLGVRLRFIGRRDHLSPDLLRAVSRSESLTARAGRLEACIALGYGGRAEIVEAVRGLVAEHPSPEEVGEDTIASRLQTPAACDLDLIVYAGDRPRFSDLLLWQMAYAEFYAAGTGWPDLTAADLEQAVESFASRSRRRGGIEPADTGS